MTNVFFDDLPADLINAAYKHGSELAWTRNQALEVIDALGRKKCRLLGIDTWLLTKDNPPRPNPLQRDWNAERDTGVEDTISSAMRFVITFRCRPDDYNFDNRPVYFNIITH